MAPMKEALSFLLHFRLSGCFLQIVSLVFSKFWHGGRNPYEVGCDSQIFQKKMFCLENLENRPKMDQKHGFWNLLKDFAINFY